MLYGTVDENVSHATDANSRQRLLLWSRKRNHNVVHDMFSCGHYSYVIYPSTESHASDTRCLWAGSRTSVARVPADAHARTLIEDLSSLAAAAGTYLDNPDVIF
ncbi:unnamed protein product [Rangifer tarandus platyrhynchus]|uniref:Uncharacterized protein n=1 Tax=Rangifer tarandus platyrhynchus TaxID=3082113 RepID=A0ABN8XKA3_RANTA|nr:unnamed protein product [Rangifer tarandus platyrhynchus]